MVQLVVFLAAHRVWRPLRPNPAVKLTNIGGAHLLVSLASSTPLFAAYLLR